MPTKKGSLALSLSTVFFILVFVIAVSFGIIESLIEKVNLLEVEQIMQTESINGFLYINEDMLGSGSLQLSAYTAQRDMMIKIAGKILEIKGIHIVTPCQVEIKIEGKEILIKCQVEVRTPLSNTRTVKGNYSYFIDISGG